VLDLGAGAADVGQLTELTPRIARAYAGKTAKTVQRDLNALMEMGLVVREGRKVRALREIILAFLPLKKYPAAGPKNRPADISP
jgi:pyocin large subunit-like protein